VTYFIIALCLGLIGVGMYYAIKKFIKWLNDGGFSNGGKNE
jgi:hypothetical protein